LKGAAIACGGRGTYALEPSGSLQDPQHLRATGHLSVGRELPAGEYTLQVIVTDKLAKSKSNVATQSMDFEIEE
jgi:hypothetical protein